MLHAVVNASSAHVVFGPPTLFRPTSKGSAELLSKADCLAGSLFGDLNICPGSLVLLFSSVCSIVSMHLF